MTESRFILELPLRCINAIQVASIVEMLNAAKAAHYIDIGMRINGQNVNFEADWLKHITLQEPTP